MTTVDHVEAIKRDLRYLRIAYQLGEAHARSGTSAPHRSCVWSPAIRTAYFLGKLMHDPDTVTDDEIQLMDFSLLVDIEAKQAD